MAKGEVKYLVTLLLFSLLIRILISPFSGYKIDLSTFAAWFYTTAEYGPRVFYEAAGWCDYPPFNVYIFWVFGSFAKWFSLFGTRFLVYLIKLPSNLFDTATALIIFLFVRRRLDFKPSLMATSFYAFNPATIFNTSIWGQYDAIYTFFLILSLMFIFNSKPKASVAAFTVAVLTKPQSIALVPLLVLLIIRKRSWKLLITSTLVLAVTVLAVIAPFKWSNPIDFLVSIYLEGYGGYPYTSINAFNIWALGGFWKSDAQTFMFLDFFAIGWIMFGVLTALSLYYLNKRLDGSQEFLVLFSAFVILFGFFMLPTRIHERYLFPVFSVLALLFPFLKKTRPIYLVLTSTYLANQAYVLSFLNNDNFIQNGDPFVWIVTLTNLMMFLYTLILMFKQLRGRNWLNSGAVNSLKNALGDHIENANR